MSTLWQYILVAIIVAVALVVIGIKTYKVFHTPPCNDGNPYCAGCPISDSCNHDEKTK